MVWAALFGGKKQVKRIISFCFWLHHSLLCETKCICTYTYVIQYVMLLYYYLLYMTIYVRICLVTIPVLSTVRVPV